MMNNSFLHSKLPVKWHSLLALLFFAFVPAARVQAAPPDLTAGGVPADSGLTTLGPTGMRGWVYHSKYDSSESRQILVKVVNAGSPAAGIFQVNDVILGADGSGASPVNFTADARKSLADAIGEAEARTPATLQLIRWRAGAMSTVQLTLQTMGAYSPTAPYNCSKSALILEQGLQYVMDHGNAGRWSLGALPLLAGNAPSNPNNAARQAQAKAYVYAMLPDAEEMALMNSDEVEDWTTKLPWRRGHELILLAEYYLQTADPVVLPAIDAMVNTISKGQSMFGTMGHSFAGLNADGSVNGPYGIGYGPVNSAGLPCFFGLVLARQCGITNPRLDPAIERGKRFFGYYAGKGTIPYGEHPPYANHTSNGKSGIAAITFELIPERPDVSKFFAQMATAGASEREGGHTGYYFNAMWTPLGAAVGGEDAAASFFSQARWHFELSRRWDGGFDYSDITSGGSNTEWNNLDMDISTLLTYALPLRQLHLTGRGRSPAGCLTSGEVAAASFANVYVAASRSTSELLGDLGSFSPQVRSEASTELGRRPAEAAALLPTLHAMATAPNGGNSRIGASQTLGAIHDASSVTVLATLLTDPVNEVRRQAGIALANCSKTSKLTVLNTILQAVISTAKPVLPLDEEDPLHLAFGKLTSVLFDDGKGLPEPGALYGSIAGVDRNLLYPAVRALAATPTGSQRADLRNFFPLMTQADFEALADLLVDSVQVCSPADKMFSATVRFASLDELRDRHLAEAVPLSIIFYKDDDRYGIYNNALSLLTDYAGDSLKIAPDPQVLEFLNSRLNEEKALVLSGDDPETTQAVIDIILADTNPTKPATLKSIQSVTADATSLTLPASQTTLRVSASDLAKGNLVYTWRKVRGAGNVSFTPNGTAAAKDAVAVFDGTPGSYLFEVTMSDSRGLTEVSGTVGVTLRDVGGGLPPNSPPTANPQSVSATLQQVPVPITLTGIDPEGLPLIYTITRMPAQGGLSGTAPDLVYNSNPLSLETIDSFTFEVMDSEGQTDEATVTINIDNSFADIIWVRPTRDGVVPAQWNALLTGAGYTVTGFIGQTTPNTAEQAFLNAGSLIIYESGGVSNQQYSAGAGAVWNRLRTPLIQMDANFIDDWDWVAWNSGSGTNNSSNYMPEVFVPDDPVWNGVTLPLQEPLATRWRVRNTETLNYGGSRIAGEPGRTTIARWPAGAIPTGTIPGGPRMFFSGSPTVGEYTLTSLGERVFLNAVASMIDNTVMASVPRLVGFSQAEAEAAIVASQFVVGTITTAYSDTVAAGHVISQSPAGTSILQTRTFVDLVISAGPQPRTTVPDVVGLDQATAESNIFSAQLTLGKVTMIYNDTVAAGNVISQSLTAGVVALIDTPMDLVVSAGISNITVNFQEGVSPTASYTQDATYIRSSYASTIQNVDSDNEFIVGSANSSGTDKMRGLLEFDISTLAATTDLTSVSLVLTTRTDTGGSGASETFRAYSYAHDVDETKATWNKPDVAGADVPGGTAGTLLSSTSFTVTLKGKLVTFGNTPAFLTAVADALAGDGVLRLILIRSVENSLGFARFTADSSPTAENRPKLVIEYKPPNIPPEFFTDPIQAADAMQGKPYVATLAESASDVNANPLSYAKVSGPPWLAVETDGTLSGVPTFADIGANTFTISVSDGIAPPVPATLNITVLNNIDAPVLVATTPPDGATGVVTDIGLTMTFNKSIFADVGFITLRNETDGVQQTIETNDTSQVTITGPTLVVYPIGGLAAHKNYTVLIDDGAFQDLAGNSFAGLSDPSAWNFATAGPTSPYNIWATGTFTEPFVGTEPGDNQDSDALINLLEFAFGTDPTASDSSPLSWGGAAADAVPGTPVIHRLPGAGANFTARFMRRADHGNPGSVSYAWRFGSDLSDWESSADAPGWLAPPTVLATDASGQYELVEVAYPAWLDSSREARFFQVVVTDVP